MIVLIVTLLSLQVHSKPIAPRKVVYAVDCGGIRDIRSSLGVMFLKDVNFTKNSQDVDYYIEPEMLKPHVRYSPDTHIYMSERHAETDFSYFIPIQKDWSLPTKTTDFVLILKFAEFFFKEANVRVFDIALGDKIVVKDLDVFSLVGFSTAHDEYLEIQYLDSDIYFKGQKCDNALNQNNELVVTFIKTQYDNPMIHAIMLFQGKIEETDYTDREEYKNSWDRRHTNSTPEEREAQRLADADVRQKHIEKRQSIIKVREGFENEIEKAAEPIEENSEEETRPKLPPMSWELFVFMVTSPMGIVCLIGFLTSTFVLFAFTFFDPYGQKKLMQQLEEQQRIYRERRRTNQNTEESSTSSVSDPNEVVQRNPEVEMVAPLKSPTKAAKVQIKKDD